MTPQEAVDALDGYTYDDPEGAHVFADNIIMAFVPGEIAEAYERLIVRQDGFWYA